MEADPNYGGWCHSCLVVLASIRKQAEQDIMSKPLNSADLWPLHQFLPSSSWSVLIVFDDELLYKTVNEINPFSPNLFWSWRFHHCNSNDNEDTMETPDLRLAQQALYPCTPALPIHYSSPSFDKQLMGMLFLYLEISFRQEVTLLGLITLWKLHLSHIFCAEVWKKIISFMVQPRNT